MSKSLSCNLCGLYLGSINSGAVRKGAMFLCQGCWERAKAAIALAEFSKGDRQTCFDDDPMLDSLRGMFGMGR